MRSNKLFLELETLLQLSERHKMEVDKTRFMPIFFPQVWIIPSTLSGSANNVYDAVFRLISALRLGDLKDLTSSFYHQVIYYESELTQYSVSRNSSVV